MTSYTQEFRTVPERDLLYIQEQLILDVTESICQLLSQRGLSQSDLADRLGVTKSRVSQYMDGANLTLRTVAKIFWTLGEEVTICPRDSSASTPSMWRVSQSPITTPFKNTPSNGDNYRCDWDSLAA